MPIASLLFSAFTPVLDSAQFFRPISQAVIGSAALDGLSLFVLLVTIVVSLIGLWASIGRPGMITYIVLIVLFIGSVFLMVSATNLLLFYIFWEIVTVISWGIARRSGVHSLPALGPLPVQGIGGLATAGMLAALTFLAVENRTLVISAASTGALGIVTVGLLAAVYLKSYGLLTQTWLPGEPIMAGASNGLLAGAAIIAVGFYPFARFLWIILGNQSGWQDIALPVSLAISVVAALIALGESDTRRLVSYGVLSQLAWFLAAFTIFGPDQAGVLFLALFTGVLALSGLFIILGLAESVSGERDLRQSGGLISAAPVVGALFVLLALAAVGLPPFGGFIGRLTVELPLIVQGNMPVALILFGIVVLTLLYLMRLFRMVFLGELRQPVAPVRGASEYLAVSALLIVLLTIGVASPMVAQWIQTSFALPIG